MIRLNDFRQAMMNWKRFFFAAFLVFALLGKFGVPMMTVVPGLAAAAFLNWQLRPRGTHV